MQFYPSGWYVLKESTKRKIDGVEGVVKGPEEVRHTLKVPRKKVRVAVRESDRAGVLDDELGKYIARHSALFVENTWEQFIRQLRPRGDLREPGPRAAHHPARHLLHQLNRRGAPMLATTPPWSQKKLRRFLKRGSHKSCQEHLDFLREEMLDFVRKGFWTVLPYRLLEEHLKELFPHLRLSPLGVVPQRGRRPRIIVDLSYYGINQETLRLAPEEAMQFGRTLERILYRVMSADPRYGPVYLGKVDLADGFYRVGLVPHAILKLAVIFPRYPGEEQMVALPLVLPMGWVESVPYFCSVTETVADLVNRLPPRLELGPHPLEDQANTPPEEHTPVAPDDQAPLGPPVLAPAQRPVRHVDVYIDDFILAIQGLPAARRRLLRQLLHMIDQVFRPVDNSDSPYRKHTASVKKMLQGDAYLCTRKVVLGWLIDTMRKTLELPPHRAARLFAIFDDLRHATRIGERAWRRVLGELRSMSIGVPGSRGLFSALQEGLRYSEKGRLRITPGMRAQLADYEHLARDLASRPTAIAEVIPDLPVAVGPHDASGVGMGGVWLPATVDSNLTPLLWRARFPPDVVSNLVSFANPHGQITNSDLELAGGIAHQDVLVTRFNCAGRTVEPLADNTNSVGWHHRGSTSYYGVAAKLLGVNSLHQRHYRYLAKSSYIPGKANTMADDCSRLWNLTDDLLLSYFNERYPQTMPWELVPMRPAMYSAIISALRDTRPEPQSYLHAPPTRMVIGTPGSNLLPSSTQTLISETAHKRKGLLFSRFSPISYDTESLRPAATLSEVAQWRITYVPSARRYPSWMRKV